MKKVVLSLLTVAFVFSFALSSKALAMGKSKPVSDAYFKDADDTVKKNSRPAPDAREIQMETGLIPTEEDHSG